MPQSDSGRIHQADLSKTIRKTAHRRYRMSHAALRDCRQLCINELKRLGADSGANPFFEKAMILLTRFWVEIPWKGRAKLLKDADWLVHAGCQFHTEKTDRSPAHPLDWHSSPAAATPPRSL